MSSFIYASIELLVFIAFIPLAIIYLVAELLMNTLKTVLSMLLRPLCVHLFKISGAYTPFLFKLVKFFDKDFDVKSIITLEHKQATQNVVNIATDNHQTSNDRTFIDSLIKLKNPTATKIIFDDIVAQSEKEMINKENFDFLFELINEIESLENTGSCESKESGDLYGAEHIIERLVSINDSPSNASHILKLYINRCYDNLSTRETSQPPFSSAVYNTLTEKGCDRNIGLEHLIEKLTADKNNTPEINVADNKKKMLDFFIAKSKADTKTFEIMKPYFSSLSKTQKCETQSAFTLLFTKMEQHHFEACHSTYPKLEEILNNAKVAAAKRTCSK